MGSTSAGNSPNDETIICASCVRSFIFSEEEKDLHARNGYQNKPKRCPNCRQRRKAGNGHGTLASVTSTLTESEVLLETCKAVGELRVFVENQFRDLNKRLDEMRSGDEG